MEVAKHFISDNSVTREMLKDSVISSEANNSSFFSNMVGLN